jgi:hypothetical protein
MLLPLLPDLAAQMEQLNIMVPRGDNSFPLCNPAFVNITSVPLASSRYTHYLPSIIISISIKKLSRQTPGLRSLLVSVSISHIYLRLVSNTITQLCLAATRVSAPTLTLVLVIGKAISLIISMILYVWDLRSVV